MQTELSLYSSSKSLKSKNQMLICPITLECNGVSNNTTKSQWQKKKKKHDGNEIPKYFRSLFINKIPGELLLWVSFNHSYTHF